MNTQEPSSPLFAFHVRVLHTDPEVYIYDRDGFLNLFSEELEKWKEKKDGYRYDTLSVLYRIMAKARGERRAQIISETLSPAIDFIHKNYTNPELSVSEIASYAHISETYLRRKFIEKTGISPKKHIINLRLQNARSLLNAGYNTVSEIAELCGFNDPKHFPAIYRKYTGSVPSKQHYTFKDEGGTVYFCMTKIKNIPEKQSVQHGNLLRDVFCFTAYFQICILLIVCLYSPGVIPVNLRKTFEK